LLGCGPDHDRIRSLKIRPNLRVFFVADPANLF